MMNELLHRRRFPDPVDHEAVRRDWGRRGYSCSLFVDPPGRCWTDFVHGTNELVTVVEGRLELEVGDVRLEAGPGDEVFIPKGAVHTVRNMHAGETRWLFGYD
jgi:mannose-6-phosphate isomerase-like protein (cupin superfamily)